MKYLLAWMGSRTPASSLCKIYLQIEADWKKKKRGEWVEEVREKVSESIMEL